MKAAVWYGPRDLRVTDVPEPRAEGNKVLLRVNACGICGSDLHEYLHGPVIIPSKPHPLTGKLPPVILGHEFSACVVETGPEAVGVQPGDRVAVNACLVCHDCPWCRRGQYNLCAVLGSIGLTEDGGFAEYVAVPDYTCHLLPDSVSDALGALAEPLAVAIHALRRGRLEPGETVAVVGAGPIGILALQAARALGAGRVYVIEPVGFRREMALRMGADDACDPTTVDPGHWIAESTDGLRADLVVEAVGRPGAVEVALKCSGKGARISVAGIFAEAVSFPIARLQAHEKELIGSSAYPSEFPVAIRLLGEGTVRPELLITSRIRLEEIVERGIGPLLSEPSRQIKILVSP